MRELLALLPTCVPRHCWDVAPQPRPALVHGAVFQLLLLHFFKVFFLAVYLKKMWLRCLADFRQDNPLSDSAKCISEYANLPWQNLKVVFELLSCVML